MLPGAWNTEPFGTDRGGFRAEDKIIGRILASRNRHSRLQRGESTRIRNKADVTVEVEVGEFAVHVRKRR